MPRFVPAKRALQHGRLLVSLLHRSRVLPLLCLCVAHRVAVLFLPPFIQYYTSAFWSGQRSWFVTKPLSHHDSLIFWQRYQRIAILAPTDTNSGAYNNQICSTKDSTLGIRLVCAGVRTLFWRDIDDTAADYALARLVLASPTISSQAVIDYLIQELSALLIILMGSSALNLFGRILEFGPRKSGCANPRRAPFSSPRHLVLLFFYLLD